MAETQQQAWRPRTAPVAAEDLRRCPVLVVHYWAVWNLHDRTMDELLLPLCVEYDDRICFRSCDVDRAEDQSFVHGIANIPALGFFVRGEWVRSVVGMRSAEQFRSAFDELLAPGDAQANSAVTRSAGDGMLSVLRRLISRKRG